MGFRYNEISVLMQTDVCEAHARLTALFDTHEGNVTMLADALEVDRATVFRWLKRLDAAGFSDPRGGKRGRVGRRPIRPREPHPE